jgi:hypothetical protein
LPCRYIDDAGFIIDTTLLPSSPFFAIISFSLIIDAIFAYADCLSPPARSADAFRFSISSPMIHYIIALLILRH